MADNPPHLTPHHTSPTHQPPPVLDPNQQTNRFEQSGSTSSLSPQTTPASSALPRVPELNSDSADFNYFEEEFQVQLALAISVSDPDSREDPETAQIKAAQEISLGCSPLENPVEFLSLRYWVYSNLPFNLLIAFANSQFRFDFFFFFCAYGCYIEEFACSDTLH